MPVLRRVNRAPRRPDPRGRMPRDDSLSFRRLPFNDRACAGLAVGKASDPAPQPTYPCSTEGLLATCLRFGP